MQILIIFSAFEIGQSLTLRVETREKRLRHDGFLTKPKELKNLNDSIKRIADLFNYFSDMAKDFKQNPFMKSIHSDFFYKEQEIKKERIQTKLPRVF